MSSMRVELVFGGLNGADAALAKLADRYEAIANAEAKVVTQAEKLATLAARRKGTAGSAGGGVSDAVRDMLGGKGRGGASAAGPTEGGTAGAKLSADLRGTAAAFDRAVDRLIKAITPGIKAATEETLTEKTTTVEKTVEKATTTATQAAAAKKVESSGGSGARLEAAQQRMRAAAPGSTEEFDAKVALARAMQAKTRDEALISKPFTESTEERERKARIAEIRAQRTREREDAMLNPPPPRAAGGPAERLRLAQARLAVATTPEQEFDARVAVAQAQHAQQRAQDLIERAARPEAHGQMGSAERLQLAQRRLATATTPQQAFDARVALQRTQEAYRRDQERLERGPTDRGDVTHRLMDLIGTTRVGIGAGGMTSAMPLVNRVAALFGPQGLVIGAVVGGILGLGESIAKAFDEVNNRVTNLAFGAMSIATGARVTAGLTGGTQAQVAAIQQMGFNPMEAAGLRERIATNPFAAMAAGMVGVGPQAPRPFGDVNEAKILQQALQGLHNITNAEEQLRAARALGLEGALDLVRVSERVWQQQLRDAELKGRIYDQDRTYFQAVRDFAGDQRHLMALNQIGAYLTGRPLLVGQQVQLQRQTAMAAGYNTLIGTPQGQMALTGLALVLEGYKRELLYLSPAGWVQLLLEGLGKLQQNNTKAQSAQTKATEELTKVLRRGLFGGSTRSRNVVPQGFLGSNPQDWRRREWEMMGMDLGFWTG